MAGERFRIEMFESLTRKHVVFCIPPREVELNDVLSPIGNIVGSHNIRAACRMNKKFVVFVSEEHMVAMVIEHGLFIEPLCVRFSGPNS